MTVAALALVLSSALLHATWNLLAKRASGGLAFVWLFTVLDAILYAPLAIVALVLLRPHIGWLELAFIGGSALLHIAYFLSLQSGYRNGDLSLVYPLARGGGPALATVGAIVLLAERPSALALSGTALIVLSAFVISGTGRLAGQRRAVGFGLLTAVFIASYTIWDGYAVADLAIHPVLLMWGSGVTRSLLLTPGALARWAEVRQTWRHARREAFGVALLSPLAYILVLVALTFTPVSYVAPAREISILIGTVMGTRLLAEGEPRRRLAAAAGMVLGVLLLALG